MQLFPLKWNRSRAGKYVSSMLQTMTGVATKLAWQKFWTALIGFY